MKYYKIADLYFRIAGAEYQTFHRQLKQYEIAPMPQTDVTVEFCRRDSITIPEQRRVYVVDAGRHYFELPDGYGFYDQIGQAFVTCFTADTACKKLTYQYCDMKEAIGIPDETAIFNVLGNLLQQILLHHDGVVIHASAIAYQGQAVAFSAPSGTGKSTHTALWKQYYPDVIQLNDDTPVLRMEQAQCVAYGTPWSGKSNINRNQSAPLRALVFLERGDENSMTPITPFQAFGRLLTEIHLPFRQRISELLLERLDRLVRMVPAYVLRCDVSRDAVEVVRGALFGTP